MRISVQAAAAMFACLLVMPASAAQTKFAPETFQIFGGLGNSPTKQPRRQYRGMRTVEFQTSVAPGSIIVRTYARRLYYVLPDGKAIEYGVGVGREGFTWA